MSLEDGRLIGPDTGRLPVWSIDRSSLPYEQMALNLVEHVDFDQRSIRRAVRNLARTVRKQHSKPQLATEYARGLLINAIYIHSPQYLSAEAALDYSPVEITAMNEREREWIIALEGIYPARSVRRPFGVDREAFEHYQRARTAHLSQIPKSH